MRRSALAIIVLLALGILAVAALEQNAVAAVAAGVSIIAGLNAML